jgi:hypothetical protein
MAEAKGRRTDLNMPQAKVKRMVAQNQTYGAAGEQMASQKAVPMGAPPTEVAGRKQALPPLPSFTRRTDRPQEPITAGAPFGPGVGPVAAGVPSYNPTASALQEIRTIAELEQNEDLMDLLSRWMA